MKAEEEEADDSSSQGLQRVFFPPEGCHSVGSPPGDAPTEGSKRLGTEVSAPPVRWSSMLFAHQEQ